MSYSETHMVARDAPCVRGGCARADADQANSVQRRWCPASPPEPVHGIEVVPTIASNGSDICRGSAQGSRELVGAMDPAAIDDHHDLFAGGAESRHHLMDILAQLLGIKVGHDFIEDFRGALLHRTDDAEQTHRW